MAIIHNYFQENGEDKQHIDDKQNELQDFIDDEITNFQAIPIHNSEDKVTYDTGIIAILEFSNYFVIL